MSKSHGLSRTRIYHVWNQMIRRCENPNAKEWKYYGGKGVSVCREWHNVEVFAKWAYENGYDDRAPRGECTIDRIDGNGNYEPSNCRWVDQYDQIHNRNIRLKRAEKPKKSNGIQLDTFDDIVAFFDSIPWVD